VTIAKVVVAGLVVVELVAPTLLAEVVTITDELAGLLVDVDNVKVEVVVVGAWLVLVVTDLLVEAL
jgi:hypothetical protein